MRCTRKRSGAARSVAGPTLLSRRHSRVRPIAGSSSRRCIPSFTQSSSTWSLRVCDLLSLKQTKTNRKTQKKPFLTSFFFSFLLTEKMVRLDSLVDDIYAYFKVHMVVGEIAEIAQRSYDSFFFSHIKKKKKKKKKKGSRLTKRGKMQQRLSACPCGQGNSTNQGRRQIHLSDPSLEG